MTAIAVRAWMRSAAPARNLDRHAPAVYVVTMDTRPITGPGSLAGLRRMSIREACDVAALAVRAMRHPRIVHADTLTVVATY